MWGKKTLALLILILAPIVYAQDTKNFEAVIRLSTKQPGLVGFLKPTTGRITNTGRKDLILPEGFIQIFTSGYVLSYTQDLKYIRSAIPIPKIGIGLESGLAVVVVDLNDDYLDDLLVLSDKMEMHHVYNTGGGFKVGPSYPMPYKDKISPYGFRPIQVEVKDVDGDSRPDIIMCAASDTLFSEPEYTSIVIVSGRGYNTAYSITNPTVLSFSTAIQDGLTYIVARETNTRVSILTQKDRHRISFSSYTWKYKEEFSHVNIGDMNGDGKLDLIFFTKQGKINIAWGNGTGNFGSNETTLPYEIPSKYRVAQAAIEDLTGNGVNEILLLISELSNLEKQRPEIIVLSQSIGSAWAESDHIQLGDLTLSASGEMYTPAFDLIDFDGDDTLDILAGPMTDVQNKQTVVLVRGKNKIAGSKLYGTGTPKNSPPEIFYKGRAKLGEQLEIWMSDGPPSSYASLHMGIVCRPWPLVPWLDIRVFPVLVTDVFKTDTEGRAHATLRIPVKKELVGLYWYSQWYYATGTYPPVNTTKAIKLTIED